MKNTDNLKALTQLCRTTGLDFFLRQDGMVSSNMQLPDTVKLGRTLYEALKVLGMPHELELPMGRKLRYSEGTTPCSGPVFELVEILAGQMGLKLTKFKVGEATRAVRTRQRREWDLEPTLEALRTLPAEVAHITISLQLRNDAERSSFLAQIRRRELASGFHMKFVGSFDTHSILRAERKSDKPAN